MKCALPGMYGRKIPIDYAALSKSYLDITKESLLSEPEDDFYNFIKELEKNRKDYIGSLTYYYGRGSGKSEKSFEELKRELLQKDKEANEMYEDEWA